MINFIDQNIYLGFVSVCNKNKAVKFIPSKDTLENLGCTIDKLSYLHTLDGKSYNLLFVNPTLISDEDVKKAFDGKACSAPRGNSTAKENDAEHEDPEDLQTFEETTKELTKVCKKCKIEKPIIQFKKRPGRGNNHKDTCRLCESTQKENTPSLPQVKKRASKTGDTAHRNTRKKKG